MIKVFLGFTKVDHDRVIPIFDLLRERGLNVWWDPELRDYDRWDLSIQQALLEASCVIVVWTRQSVGRFWLHEEARFAFERNILVQVILEEVEVPAFCMGAPTVHVPGVTFSPINRQELMSVIQTVVSSRDAEILREEIPSASSAPIGVGRSDLKENQKTFGEARTRTPAVKAVEIEVGIEPDLRKLRIVPSQSTCVSHQFQDTPYSPAMIVVQAGSFMMGSPEGDSARNERPRHGVLIRKPFAMSSYPITFEEWDYYSKCEGDQHIPNDGGWGRGRRPVINVSWLDAERYVQWLSRMTMKEYRLPTEAEWEYCCRAGSATPYCTGFGITHSQANYSGGRTTKVGAFMPNDWGLFDMHGNVWEWCKDTWHPNYVDAPTDGAAWEGGDESLRVVRGGSWVMFRQLLRSAQRDYFRSDGRAINTGFRVVRRL